MKLNNKNFVSLSQKEFDLLPPLSDEQLNEIKQKAEMAREAIIKKGSRMGSHLVNGRFQSDKYPTCPAGKVPLSVEDPIAQDLLWEYAQRRRKVDTEFADDLEMALKTAGYNPCLLLKIMDTVVLYRPTDPQELELIRQSGWKKFPPRLSEQPIFILFCKKIMQ